MFGRCRLTLHLGGSAGGEQGRVETGGHGDKGSGHVEYRHEDSPLRWFGRDGTLVHRAEEVGPASEVANQDSTWPVRSVE